MRYLGRFLSAADSTASLRHAAYALVVVFACGWLTWDMIRGPITTEWNFAFGLLLGAVTTGKIVGAAASTAPDSVAVPGNGSSAVDGGKFTKEAP